MNVVLLVLVVGAVGVAAFGGQMAAVNEAWMEAAKAAVRLALELVGLMALWLGLMRILRDGGAMRAIGRGLAPVMRRLFPDVPSDHPAMSAMILNLAANMLGLGNAATPFGLKAMRELNTLNSRPGVATDSMALFLAMNTSGVAVLPLGVIAIRSSLGSTNAGGILVPTLLATLCSTLVAVLVAKALQSRPRFEATRFEQAESEAASDSPISGMDDAEQTASIRARTEGWRRLLSAGVMLVLLGALVHYLVTAPAGPGEAAREAMSSWLLPLLMAGIVLFGFSRRVPVYESLIKGAREGFDIAVTIIPFLVAILVAVAMFRASGALGWMITALDPLTSLVGFPAEALPMALVRPLSGSGAMGVMTETMQANGPDSFVGNLVSVMNGSTETTFYVLALYFGSVRVRAMRHALLACLSADFAGVVAALLWTRLLI